MDNVCALCRFYKQSMSLCSVQGLGRHTYCVLSMSGYCVCDGTVFRSVCVCDGTVKSEVT